MNTFIRSSSCLLIGSLVLLGVQSKVIAGNTRPIVKDNITQLTKTKSCPGCDLSGADLNRLDLSDANLQGADLSKAKLYLTNLARADLRNANLQGAVFGGADLGGADLRGVDLEGVKLSGAYIVGARLEGDTTEAISSEQSKETKEARQVVTASEKQGVSISERRDFEESPPVIQEKGEEGEAAEISGMPMAKEKQAEEVDIVSPTVQPDFPPAKTVTPIQDVVIGKNALDQPSGDAVDEPITSIAEDSSEKPVKKESGEAAPEVGKKELGVVEEEYVVKSRPVEPETVNTGGMVSEDETLSVDRYDSAATAVVSEPHPSDQDTSEEASVGLREDEMREGVLATQKGADSEARESGLGTLKEKVTETSTRKNRMIEKLLDTNKCYGCDLAGVDLSGKDLEEADLEAADLTGSNLEGVELQGANLKGSLLRNANMRNADLREVDLYKADLTGADLTGADLREAKVDEAKFLEAIGVQMESVFIAE